MSKEQFSFPEKRNSCRAWRSVHIRYLVVLFEKVHSFFFSKSAGGKKQSLWLRNREKSRYMEKCFSREEAMKLMDFENKCKVSNFIFLSRETHCFMPRDGFLFSKSQLQWRVKALLGSRLPGTVSSMVFLTNRWNTIALSSAETLPSSLTWASCSAAHELQFWSHTIAVMYFQQNTAWIGI